MINISYSAWKNFRECPKKYFYKNVRDVPSTIPRNDYYTLYGRLTEKFFEYFSNIWRFNLPYMTPEDIKNRLEIVYKNILSYSVVDWSDPIVTCTKEEIFNQSYKDVCTIMDSMNQNFFLNTKSEVSIQVRLKDDIRLNCRADFIHKDAITPAILIFDGKGTDKIGKNVDEKQLLFYALLYFLHYKVLPSELGFFYYRFNAFRPVNINIDIMNEFRAQLSLDIKKILEQDFKATPCSKSCRYCDYRLTCSDLREYAAKRKKKSKIQLPGNGEEVCEFGF